MRIEAGQRFFNRAGAIVEVAKIETTGYQKRHPVTWAPLGPVRILFCRIVRCQNGRKPPADAKLQYGLHEDGHYLPIGDHELDLVKEVLDVAA